MKIKNVRISNFRGIKDVLLENLGSMVVIAGQNGSGKSCVFDAIRLLKSVYGGYQQNEWQQWMGEFQILITNRSSDFHKILNDINRELKIECDFELAAQEKEYIIGNAMELLKERIFRVLIPEAFGWGSLKMAQFAAQFRERDAEVTEQARVEYAVLMEELQHPTLLASCFLPVGGELQIRNSLALSLIFSNFRPKHIGVIDYHGAQRHYQREGMQGIQVNFNVDSHEQIRSQSALYNYASKYHNVKSELAGTYVKELIIEDAGIERQEQANLTNTLKELFTTFFPGKEFLGPQPTLDGGITFNVKSGAPNLHDLDELSAGEKEILYGYLRIRNTAPRFSIVLIDEPELHLNPRLIRGLPAFYHKNIGEALGNQVWLITHSDALLREVVGHEEYNVFHMLPCAATADGENQIKELSAKTDLDMAIVDLVGDIAAYRPGGKVIIFEGGGDSDFDKKMVSTLFPEIVNKANLVSGSNKSRVRALHEILDKASKNGELPFQFYSITDKDSDDESQKAEIASHYSWDVYHIENYLLNSKYIMDVVNDLALQDKHTEYEVEVKLKDCARKTIPALIRHDMSEFVSREIIATIDLGTDSRVKDGFSSELDKAIARSLERLMTCRSDKVSINQLAEIEKEFKQKYEGSLEDGSWRSILKGRDILKLFVGEHVKSVKYLGFRNLILSAMARDSYCPENVKQVLDRILKA